MYDSIRIQNFRGIRDLTISNLGRINLLVGANNVGKTSVLEALWLLLGRENPNLATATATRRGVLERINPVEVWKGLFGIEGFGVPVVVEAIDHDGSVQRLTIRFFSGPRSGHFDEPVILRDNGFDRSGLFGRLEFQSVGPENPMPELVTSIEINASGFIQNLGPRSGVGALYLSSAESPHPRDLAIGFTQADDLGYLTGIVNSLREFDPRVERVSLGLSEGEESPSIRIHLSDSRTPLSSYQLGSGFVRLMQMLILIPLYGFRPALIDEVDSGIYFEALPRVWATLRTIIDNEEGQLFCSTHSWECIAAAVRSSKNWPSDFRMHRIDRTDDGLRVTTYDHEMAEAALELNVEVR